MMSPNTSSTCSTNNDNNNITEEDFARLIAEINNTNAEQLKQDNWQDVQVTNSYKVYRKKSTDSSLFTFKAYMFLKGGSANADKLVSLICDIETRSRWDPLYSNTEVVEQLDDSTDVIYSVVKTPAPVASRDYVQQRVIRKMKNNGKDITGIKLKGEHYYLMLSKSIDHPKYPPPARSASASSNKNKKNAVATNAPVRGTAHLQGYLIADDFVFIMNCNDVGGAVPSFLVNMVASRAPGQWYQMLQGAVKDAEKHLGSKAIPRYLNLKIHNHDSSSSSNNNNNNCNSNNGGTNAAAKTATTTTTTTTTTTKTNAAAPSTRPTTTTTTTKRMISKM